MLGAVDGALVSSEFLQDLVVGRPDAPGDELRRRMPAWRHASGTLGPASSVRSVLDCAAVPLLQLLGFGPPADLETVDGAIAATVHAGRSPVAVVVVPWAHRLDGFRRAAVRQALRRSARWCVLCNGRSLRVIDAGRLHTHAHVQFDLALCSDDAVSLAALERTVGAAALDGTGPLSLDALIAASERHAVGVCRSLRDGVLAGSTAALGALIARRRDTPVGAAFDQALTIVYRVLFLLFAEARALVPLWHPVYKQSYSIEALRDAAEDRSRADGLWDALRAIARLAHAGCTAGDLRVTPFNGRLFAPSRTPLAERRDLDDEAARQVLIALSTRPSRGGRRRIAYRDLGVEQLGAVYETVLDYEPRIAHEFAARRRGASPIVTLEPGSGVRKATGTFYTPLPIAEDVVRRTLAPLVRDADPDRILSLRIVDPSMGSGAFLVAACRFLAAEYEQALIRAGACDPSDISDADRALMRRRIAERCLYGIDINPMAVQLARLSMWLATLAADRPLSFLDHRLQTGDSLVGAWIRHLRTAPRRRRTASEMPLLDGHDPAPALQDAVPVRFSFETPSDTLEQVRDKERTFSAMTSHGAAITRWKQVADVWCAAWFDEASVPAAVFTALSDAVLGGRGALPRAVSDSYLAAVDRIAASRRFFHWELEFPEVFFDAAGERLPSPGFDAVIGNPPWDMLRADAGSTPTRARARSDLAALLRFTRDAGAYRSQSSGHANRYQLFVERAVDLARTGGRIGLVLPSGLATDAGSAGLRRMLFSRCAVDAIVGIDNHRGVFPIHRSVRFLLVTGSAGASTDRIACRMGLDDPSQLSTPDSDAGLPVAGVQLSPAIIERLSGPDLTIPALTSSMDLAIAERAASLFPPLGSAESWAATFGRELNATDDRDVLRPADPRRRGLPVVHGRHIDPFRVRTDDAAETVSIADARARLRSDSFMRPRLAYRDVASATNRLTLIAAILPAGCVSTHTVFCLRPPLPLAAQQFLNGFFNSFVANFLVRLRVTTHVTTGTVERLPAPPPAARPGAIREIAALARLLGRRHDPRAFATLNARVAMLYQLTPEEFTHVLATFPLVAKEDRDRALREFGRLR